jgi:hypothetical protein
MDDWLLGGTVPALHDHLKVESGRRLRTQERCAA